MKIFISHTSAMQFLIARGAPQRHENGVPNPYTLKPTRAVPSNREPPNCRLIKELGVPDGIATERLHVNTANKENRRRSKRIVSHFWVAPSYGAYYAIDQTFHVLTPEACFLQMAPVLPLAHLTELGTILCGTFSMQPFGQPTIYDVPPLTSPAKLRSFVARQKDYNGLEKARIAAEAVTGNAASPMEAKIAVLLSLPVSRGGMGIAPVMNARLQLTSDAAGLNSAAFRKPDFLWPNEAVAMEYDSREFHSSAEAAAADELRRNELSAMGLKSIVARAHHFSSMEECEALLGQLAEAMKLNKKKALGKNHKKRLETFSALFEQDRQFDPMGMQ